VARALVLVADPQGIFRAGLCMMLTKAGFDVVEAADLDAVAAAVSERVPDLALVEHDLPPAGGLPAVSLLVGRETPQTIVWSAAPAHADVLAAVRAGASGYLRKQISERELMRSVRGALRGEAQFASDLIDPLVRELQHADERERSLWRAAVLSPREREVLGLVATGRGNKQVAIELTISQNTVKRHMQNILRKLELPSRQAAMEFYDGTFAAKGRDVFSSRGLEDARGAVR
jgi:DNA-binding NarL/FixJ family response regulator